MIKIMQGAAQRAEENEGRSVTNPGFDKRFDKHVAFPAVL